MKNKTDFPNFVFFGTDEFAVAVLDALAKSEVFPSLIITAPDRPQGKYLRLLPPPVKLWAEKNKILCLQPENLKSILRSDLKEVSRSDLGLIVSYGKIIPPTIFNLPKHGMLNVHPSLLPKYRGATPIQSAILNGDEKTGVTFILLDAELDHGPIIKAKSCNLQAQNFIEARDSLAQLGAEMFLETAPLWIAGQIKAAPQDHSQATYTKKIKKEDGEFNLSQGGTLGDKGVALYRKFLAYQPWPGIYFFTERNQKKVRVIITAAHLQCQGLSLPLFHQFVIDRVKPEGKKDMLYTDFQRGFKPSKSA